jgi:hypothetical protein
LPWSPHRILTLDTPKPDKSYPDQAVLEYISDKGKDIIYDKVFDEVAPYVQLAVGNLNVFSLDSLFTRAFGVIKGINLSLLFVPTEVSSDDLWNTGLETNARLTELLRKAISEMSDRPWTISLTPIPERVVIRGEIEAALDYQRSEATDPQVGCLVEIREKEELLGGRRRS